jgi:hypothetical protein
VGGNDYNARFRHERMNTSSNFGDLVRTGMDNIVVRNQMQLDGSGYSIEDTSPIPKTIDKVIQKVLQEYLKRQLRA